ncbi:MAG: VCBS repeat-containing protein, partial [Demequinaceae bacterium]|nr:VCBS repeat-containing protein [Demequinaceae bacterium]
MTPEPSPSPIIDEGIEADPVLSVPSRALPVVDRSVLEDRAEVTGPEDVNPPMAMIETIEVTTRTELDDAIVDGVGDEYSIVVGAAEPSVPDLAGAVFGPVGQEIAEGTSGRPDLIAAELPVKSAGESITVEVVPGLADDFIPGAAFAARLTNDSIGEAAEWVEVAFDTSGFDHAFGGDYGDRLMFVALPECALTNPTDPECLTGVPLETRRDGDGVLRVYAPADAGRFTSVDGRYSYPSMLPVAGSVDLIASLAASRGLRFEWSSGGTIIAAVSGASSQAGTFAATDLSATGSWAVNEQSGAFTYSIPIAVPPVTAGPVPSVSLGYNSASTDGKTFANNGQTSLLGEGWASPTSYIERLYKPCSEDGHSTWNDQCWYSPYGGVPGQAAYLVSLNGATYDLIWDGDNRYRTSQEIGWRVTRHTGADNGDMGPTGVEDEYDEGEYFEVQTSDGSVYYFGYGHIGDAGSATNSVATVPVFGDDPGEPRCGEDADDYCVQAYRWMLDIEVDPNNNAITHFYTPEINRYAVKGVPADSHDYTRALNPDRVEYGQVWAGLAAGVTTDAEAKVEFGMVGRCVETSNYIDTLTASVSCPEMTPTNAPSFPDVPIDLMCDGTCTSAQKTPVFFTTLRLAQINTYVWDTADQILNEDWIPVDTNQLITAYPITDDNSARSLWFDSFYTHAYGDPATTDDDRDTYLTKFTGVRLNNRVDWDLLPAYTVQGPQRALDRMRISSVLTDMGGLIKVDYSTDPAIGVCPSTGVRGEGYSTWYAGAFPNGWDENDKLCFPVKMGDTEAIFHKYVVDGITLEDVVAETPTMSYEYDYIGAPAWTYPDSILYARGQGEQNWNVFRGYEVVESHAGDGTGTTTTRNQYYRGLDGRYMEDGSTAEATITRITDEEAIDDAIELQGMLAASEVVRPDDEWVSRSHTDYETEVLVSRVGEDVVLYEVKEILEPGDADGDGHVDLLVWNDDGTLDLYLGDGDGGLISAAPTAVSGSWSTYADLLAPGDWNSDGDVDLISMTSAGALYLHSGNGDGTWNAASTQVGNGWAGFADIITPGDVTGDGKADLIGVTTAGDLNLYAGTGTGGFPSTVGQWASSYPVSSVWTGNFDDDVYADLARYDGDWYVKEDGTGDWYALGAGSYSPSSVRFGDFDGNGITDIFRPTGSSHVVLYDGTGDWETLNNSSTVLSQFAFGDFDDDDNTDIYRPTGTSHVVLYDGLGSWTTINSSTTILSQLGFADFNGDGKTDVIRPDGAKHNVLWSGLAPWQTLNNSTTSIGSLAFGDFDGDDDDDIIAQYGGSLQVLYSGAAPWVDINDSTLSVSQIEIADFDGDGADDIARVSENGWEYLASATGTEDDWVMLDPDQWQIFDEVLTPGDFDGDTYNDILGQLDTGELRLFAGSGTTTDLSGAGSLFDHGFGDFAQIITPGDFDEDGKADLIARTDDGRLYLYPGDGEGGLIKGEAQQVTGPHTVQAGRGVYQSVWVKATETVSESRDPDYDEGTGWVQTTTSTTVYDEISSSVGTTLFLPVESTTVVTEMNGTTLGQVEKQRSTTTYVQ